MFVSARWRYQKRGRVVFMLLACGQNGGREGGGSTKVEEEVADGHAYDRDGRSGRVGDAVVDHAGDDKEDAE